MVKLASLQNTAKCKGDKVIALKQQISLWYRTPFRSLSTPLPGKSCGKLVDVKFYRLYCCRWNIHSLLYYIRICMELRFSTRQRRRRFAGENNLDARGRYWSLDSTCLGNDQQVGGHGEDARIVGHYGDCSMTRRVDAQVASWRSGDCHKRFVTETQSLIIMVACVADADIIF